MVRRTRWERRKAHRIVTKSNILEKQNYCCAYCYEPLMLSTATVDHVVPLSLGGADNKTNLALCCEHCNSTKGVQSLGTFLRDIKKPPHMQDNFEKMRVYLRRKIWLATQRSVKNIERVCR